MKDDDLTFSNEDMPFVRNDEEGPSPVDEYDSDSDIVVSNLPQPQMPPTPRAPSPTTPRKI